MQFPKMRAIRNASGACFRLSVALQDLVLGRTLSGGEAGLADQRDDLVDADRVHERRGLVHVLLEQGAAPVVGAEVQRNLAGPLALREPRGLDVGEVVEVEA